MSDAVKIYHNPRCSKSRDTLSLLKANGIDPEVVLYLETPPDAATLRQLLKMLNMSSARELMRQKEDLYKSLNLADPRSGPRRDFFRARFQKIQANSPCPYSGATVCPSPESTGRITNEKSYFHAA